MWLFWSIIGTLFLSALFSGLEIAFVSSNKLHLELKSKKSGPIAWALRQIIQSPSWFISSTLFANTIMLTLYGILFASILDNWLIESLPPSLVSDFSILLISTVISTLIVLFLGEFIPKSLFYINPEGLILVLALPMTLLFYVISPLVKTTNQLAKFFITNVLKQPWNENTRTYRITDLRNYVHYRTSTSESDQNPEMEVDATIFTNAIDFKGTRVRDCMVPRAEIEAVDINDSMEELMEAFITSKHSKVIVYDDHIDDVIGYCHIGEMFKKPDSIREVLQTMPIVPESMLASNLLMLFINERRSIALVVDEFGGTSGLITMEDVIEEIFGEINDEHDRSEWVEQQIDETTWLLSARHEVEYLNRKYSWDLPEGDYETLGGYILNLTEDIPETNSVVETDGFRFTIVSKENNRIDAVRLTFTDKEND